MPILLVFSSSAKTGVRLGIREELTGAIDAVGYLADDHTARSLRELPRSGCSYNDGVPSGRCPATALFRRRQKGIEITCTGGSLTCASFTMPKR